MKGKYVISTLKKADREKGITLVCCFSRLIFVPFFFRALDKMDLPRKNIHLLVYDNTADEPLAFALSTELNARLTDYLSVRLYKSYLKGHGNILGSGNEQFGQSKLHNIWSMWRRVYHMVHTPLFFQLEDDTIAPPDAYKQLFRTLYKQPKAAMVTGISTGRSTMPWIPVGLGVHKMKMKGLFCLERHSFHPNTKGIIEVDGCGVYCFAARTKPFLTGFDGYDPIKLQVPFFGLDNIFTYNMKRHGYKLFADFDVWVSHLQATPARIIAFGKDQAIELLSFWLPKANSYVQGIEIKQKIQRARRYRVKKHAPTWEI